jgi:C4-type Zn-finger protein
MTTQRMKKPGGGGGDTDIATLELGGVEIPDVEGQLQRLSEAAETAAAEKRSEKRETKQRNKEREEMMRCCGIRF